MLSRWQAPHVAGERYAASRFSRGSLKWREPQAAHDPCSLSSLPPGTKLKLIDGGLAEIRENPRDGTWLIERRLAPEPGTDEELLIVDDIAEIVPG